jgi:hypothetical protein
VLKGHLSRYLLPYDENTGTLDQANRQATTRDTDTALEGRLSMVEKDEMVGQATALRKLMRMKVPSPPLSSPPLFSPPLSSPPLSSPPFFFSSPMMPISRPHHGP